MSASFSKYCVFLLLFVCLSGYAQTTENDDDPSLKPTIGLGTGVFSFYGEISSNTGFQNPMLSRVGYDLSIGQDLTHYLNLRFYTIFGKLGATGSGVNFNQNFESTIRAGGVNLTYNFGNFLKPGRHLSPYLLVGIESFEFLSKTDLYDDKGNKYFYWSDGSIRNIDESSPDAEKAIFIVRDYKYETDIREQNLDGFGKYAERSFAVPVGAGIIFHLSDRMDFKIGSALHLTKTDLIDGRTSKSIGTRLGNKENDRFLMSSVALHYNLSGKINRKEKESKEEFTPEELLALDSGDEDNDAVGDYKDRSPFTPSGVSVDTSGIPVDTDNDRVPDFKDKQVESPSGAVVTTEGVELTDSLAEAIYLTYMDSTGAYGKRVVLDSPIASRDVYVVKVGEFKSGVPPDVINKFLSVQDITSVTSADSITTYTAGRYYSYKQAEERRAQLVKEGLTDAAVVLYKNNSFTSVTGPVNGEQEMKVIAEAKAKTETENKQNTDQGQLGVIKKPGEVEIEHNEGNAVKEGTSEPVIAEAGKMEGVVYRVQVGAYKRKLSKQVFTGLPDMVTVTAPNGVTKYLSGTFKDYKDAAQHRVDLLVKGYNGAFIVAFKDGERMNLDQTGVKYVEKKTEEEEKVERSDNEQHAINKDLVTFKIQVGVFKNEVPDDIMEKFTRIKGIEAERTKEGLQRYTVGPFKTYQEAAKKKAELIKEYNLQGAFLVAYFKERMIDVQEAIELTK
jgi:cell division protein FtsN